LSDSSENIIEQNNLSNNYNGLKLTSESDNNKITNNQFFSNIEIGLLLAWDCNDNLIYYNNFISSGVPALEDWENHWSFYGEGNYWSDYTGLDNGANGGIIF
jgi:parallel beta-helix repeat protein